MFLAEHHAAVTKSNLQRGEWVYVTGMADGRRRFRVENVVKHKGMELNPCKRKRPTPAILVAPAFQFAGHEVFQDLRNRLARANRQPMPYERLAKIMGRSVSTAFTWCEFFRHPHVLGLLSLLERFSPAERGVFLDQYLRATPTLEHASLACSPAKIAQLHGILGKGAGMSFIIGATDKVRTLFLNALGHHYCKSCETQQLPAGIDLHRPADFVPLESLLYIDELMDPEELRQCVVAHLPRVLAKRSALLLFNRVWSAVPEARPHLLNGARRKHIVIADEILPDLRDLRRHLPTPIHILTLMPAKRRFGQFRIHIRLINQRKGQQKCNSHKKGHSPR